MCSCHFWNAVHATDFHWPVYICRWAHRLLSREAKNIKHDIYFTHSLTWHTKAAHTKAINSANRHAWLLAQLIALVCAGLYVPNLHRMDINVSRGIRVPVKSILLHQILHIDLPFLSRHARPIDYTIMCLPTFMFPSRFVRSWTSSFFTRSLQVEANKRVRFTQATITHLRLLTLVMFMMKPCI